MTTHHDFHEIDVFTVGAVGQPGARTFYLQVRGDGTQVTVKCEKQQAAGIAEHLRRILSDLPEPTGTKSPAPMSLLQPFDAEFVLGPVGLGYDADNDWVVVQLEEVPDFDSDGNPVDGERSSLRAYLTRAQALHFCDHADGVVAAGRPTCVWCSQPIDPDGHACARMN